MPVRSGSGFPGVRLGSGPTFRPPVNPSLAECFVSAASLLLWYSFSPSDLNAALMWSSWLQACLLCHWKGPRQPIRALVAPQHPQWNQSSRGFWETDPAGHRRKLSWCQHEPAVSLQDLLLTWQVTEGSCQSNMTNLSFLKTVKLYMKFGRTIEKSFILNNSTFQLLDKYNTFLTLMIEVDPAPFTIL